MHASDEPARAAGRGRGCCAPRSGDAVVAGGAATASWSGGRRSLGGAVREHRRGDPQPVPAARAACRRGSTARRCARAGWTATLREFARHRRRQEGEHVALLTERLGSRARRAAAVGLRRRRDAPRALPRHGDQARGGHDRRVHRPGREPHPRRLAAIVPLVSVEARQVAWIRDLAGVDPAPRAADPARDRDDVLDELRGRGDTSDDRAHLAERRPRRRSPQAIEELYGSTRAGLPAQRGARRRRHAVGALRRPRRPRPHRRSRHPALRAALRAAAGDVLHAGRGARHDRRRCRSAKQDGRGRSARTSVRT